MVDCDKGLLCVKVLKHYMSCAVGIDCHYAQYDSEAVIQRHWQTHPVLGCVLHALADVVAVVQDVVVGKHYTFREACGSRCVLHVHYIVFLNCMLCLEKILVRHMLSKEHYLLGGEHATVFLLADVDHVLEERKGL